MKFKGYTDEKLISQLTDRFTVDYRIRAGEKEALEIAKNICVEQTVEFPAAHIEADAIHKHIIGTIEEMKPCDDGHIATISYSNQSATEEFSQFFNVIFGNSSLLPGIVVEDIHLNKEIFSWFPGPKFGIEGIRKMLNVYGRPLAFTALKPMGVPTEGFAEEAYRCALGGIDIIKDDHGLMNQSFSSYKERVRAVCEAVKRGNEESGTKTIYAPNLSGNTFSIMDRVKFAEECGAGAIMLAPGLTGYDTMEYIARHTSLPVVAHPALAGCLLDKGGGGFECGLVLGLLPRLCGADFAVFPNFGGRFSLTEAQCNSIVESCKRDFGGQPAIYPCPAGGMTFDKIDRMKEFYGTDVALLMGGGLLTVTPDITENCKTYIERLR
ncbi:MAG: ribulose 1,5-bisphosphate carboxylase large subunit [Lachnospiraceae bacterium]|nr:ribulose 1,5-bisphosphate carboxylase large subunit [Lachnospiraceae bacterium]